MIPNDVATIFVTHNAEIAHRLSLLEGKCQRIHGHSFHIKLTLHGHLDDNGICAGIDFGTLKQMFREHIDSVWDHHLHLNERDEWAYPQLADHLQMGDKGQWRTLPGLITHVADPTTENCARWICEYMWNQLEYVKEVEAISVEIQETGTNGAKWSCAREA